MSSKWQKRKTRLRELLNSSEDNDEEGLALDRILHGQSVIGKTCMTLERFLVIVLIARYSKNRRD
jgi:hypothetical protein